MRYRVHRSALVVFPLLASIAFACNPSDPDGESQDDGGTIDTGAPFDGSTPSDAASADGGGGDDGSVSAGSINVTALHNDLSPEVGADVYFFEDTAAVFHTTTDASGNASHAVGHATSVTVFHIPTAYQGDREIVSVLAAMPGDHVTVGREGHPPVGIGGSVMADIPSNAGFTGATEYGEEMGDCVQAANTQTMLPVTAGFTTSTGCWTSGTMTTVLVSANDSSGVLAYAAKSATPSTTTPPTLTFAAGDWQATTPKATTFTGTPPATWASTVGASVRFANAAGSSYALQASYVSVPTDFSTLAFNYTVPPTVAVAMNSELYAYVGTGLSSARSSLYRHGDPTGTLAFDYAHLLPKLGAATATGTASTPLITWTSDTALTKGSSGIVELHASGDDAGVTLRWRIVFPVDGNQITPPALPSDNTRFQPSNAWVAKTVSVSSGAVDYAALRQTPTATPQSLLDAPGTPAGEVATTTNVLP